ncbi:MAG: Polysaccharide biosynthesis protein [bacterium ADurb.Bin374]|nr:MAG: Polysaccharide biosynthesis protein [bacterium ADurb.Bin374]
MKVPAILRQLTTVVGSAYLCRAINLVISLILLRRWDLAQLGEFYTIVGYWNTCTILSDLGLGRILVTRLQQAPDRSSHLISQGMMIRAVTSMAAYAFTVGLAWLIAPSFPVRWWTTVYLLGIPFFNLRTVIHPLLQVRKQFGVIAGMDLAMSVVHLAVVWWFLATLDIGTFLGVMMATNAATALYALWYVRRTGFEWQAAFERKPLRELFMAGVPLGLSGICHMAYYHVDLLVVSAFWGNREAGVLGIAKRLLDLGIILADSVMLVALPGLAKAWRKGNEALDGVAAGTFRLMGGLLLPAIGAMLLFPDVLLDLLARQSIPDAPPVIALSTMFLIGVSYGVIQSNLLVVVGRNWMDPLFLGSLAAVSLTLNLVVVPLWASMGAAITMCAIKVVYFVSALNVGLTRPWISGYLRAVGLPWAVALACGGLARAFLPTPLIAFLAFLAASVLVGWIGFGLGRVSAVMEPGAEPSSDAARGA